MDEEIYRREYMNADKLFTGLEIFYRRLDASPFFELMNLVDLISGPAATHSSTFLTGVDFSLARSFRCTGSLGISDIAFPFCFFFLGWKRMVSWLRNEV
jgi:hypothetical protein